MPISKRVFYDQVREKYRLEEKEVKDILATRFNGFSSNQIEEYWIEIELYVTTKKLQRLDSIKDKAPYIPKICPVCNDPVEPGIAGFWRCKGRTQHAVLWRTSSIALAGLINEQRLAWCLEQIKLCGEENNAESIESNSKPDK